MQGVTLPRNCGLCGLCRVRLSHGQVTQGTLGLAIMSKETPHDGINPGSKEGEPQSMARLALLSGVLFHRVDGPRRRGRLVGREESFLHGGERDKSRVVSPDGRWNHTGGLPCCAGHTRPLQSATTVAGAIGREFVGFTHGVAAVGHERQHGCGLVNEREGLVGFGIRTCHMSVLVPARLAGFLESVTLARIAVLNTRRGAVA